MSHGITSRQRDCLDAIRAHIARTGISPSLEEIRMVLKLSSKGRVVALLNALSERGLIDRIARRARAITLTSAAATSYVLPPKVEAALQEHCRVIGKAPGDVVADAVLLLLDGGDVMEEAA